MPDEQDLDLEPESHAEPEGLLQIVKLCTVMLAVPSSANTQSSLPQSEVRTSSGHVVRKPARLRDFVLFVLLQTAQ